MKINGVKAVYFSATGNTKKVMELFCKVFGEPAEYLDITNNKEYSCEIDKNSLAVIGVPSFGGRVPSIAAERLKNIKGDNTPVFILTTYGNRAYDDTLSELRSIVEKEGFIVAGSAAIVAKHSIVTDIAADRPDSKDIANIEKNVKKLKNKLINSDNILKLEHIPGNEKFRDFGGVPFSPQPTKQCVSCGICAEKCPVGAIGKDYKADSRKCIGCMRCVSVCPNGARVVSKLALKMMSIKLHKVCADIKENEFFI